MTDKTEAPGTKAWNDSAERGEWAFMAKMLREAVDANPGKNSSVYVAIDIAEARAKSGWRDQPDTDACAEVKPVTMPDVEHITMENHLRITSDMHDQAYAIGKAAGYAQALEDVAEHLHGFTWDCADFLGELVRGIRALNKEAGE